MLQLPLVEAASLACGTGPPRVGKRSFTPRWLRRVATKTRCLESRLRQLNREKVVKGFTNDKEGQIKERTLQLLAEEARAARLSHSEAIFNRNQRRAGKEKLNNAKLSTKQFWKLVR